MIFLGKKVCNGAKHERDFIEANNSASATTNVQLAGC